MSIKMFISRYEAQVYSVLRIITGFLFLWHGTQKLFKLPPAEYRIPLYIIFIAGPIEFFGGLLIMIGLWARWAALICSGEMAYAYWSTHAARGLLPLLNGGELAIVYCFIFLFIFTRGAGLFSVDSFLEKEK